MCCVHKVTFDEYNISVTCQKKKNAAVAISEISVAVYFSSAKLYVYLASTELFYSLVW